MKLFLIRHGKYLDSNFDPKKSLSPEGKSEIKELCELLKIENFSPKEIWHSEKTRALETAAILRESIKDTDSKLIEKKDLSPNDSIMPIYREINEQAPHYEQLAIVGHMPFLGSLASFLLTTETTGMTVNFNQGTTVILESLVDNKWKIDSMISP